MARVAGISTVKNTKGEITHVTIELKKHRQTFGPALEEIGVLEKSEFQKKMESQEWMTVEESRALCHKYIDEKWGK